MNNSSMYEIDMFKNPEYYINELFEEGDIKG